MVVDVVEAGAALAGEALVIAAAALLFLGLVRPCRRLLLGVKVIVKVVVRIEVSAARRLCERVRGGFHLSLPLV